MLLVAADEAQVQGSVVADPGPKQELNAGADEHPGQGGEVAAGLPAGRASRLRATAEANGRGQGAAAAHERLAVDQVRGRVPLRRREMAREHGSPVDTDDMYF